MLFLALLGFTTCELFKASCYYTSENQVKLTRDVIDTNSDAWGTYDNGLNETGWVKLHVHGNEKSDPKNMMFCAGAIEGYLSQPDMWKHFNLFRNNSNLPQTKNYMTEGYVNFMTKNMIYVKESIEAFSDMKYWRTVGLVYQQFLGLSAGYNESVNERKVDEAMTLLDQWVYQSQGDFGDIGQALDFKKTTIKGPTLTKEIDPQTFNEHCTGLIKLTKDYSDVYVAHDTWSPYQYLLGTLKEYHLPAPEFNAQRVSLSSRVGMLSSYDDFYIADSGLFVIETTMTIFNHSLYEYVTPKCLYTWLRAIHATWVAKNGSEWTETFIKHNSGTYNNQYLVVDSNKFVRYEKPTTDLLWVIEQYPGKYWIREDITEQLINDLYFPSINKPHYKELYNIAGYPEQIAASGNPKGLFYEYEKNARFLIIKREAPRLEDFEDFKAFMRYNNWKHDLYSLGDPAQQILSRYDQRPVGCPFGDAKMFGGLDSKAVRLTEGVTRLSFHAIASPPNEHNPTFNFSGSAWPETFHEGLPDVWDFPWQQFPADNYDICAGYSQKDCIEHDWCGWCQPSGKCLPGDKSGPFFDDKCEDGWVRKHVLASWAVPVIVVSCVVVLIFVGIVYGTFLYRKYKKTQLI